MLKMYLKLSFNIRIYTNLIKNIDNIQYQYLIRILLTPASKMNVEFIRNKIQTKNLTKSNLCLHLCHSVKMKQHSNFSSGTVQTFGQKRSDFSRSDNWWISLSFFSVSWWVEKVFDFQFVLRQIQILSFSRDEISLGLFGVSCECSLSPFF